MLLCVQLHLTSGHLCSRGVLLSLPADTWLFRELIMQLIVHWHMCSLEKYLLEALSPDFFCLKYQKLIVHGHKSCNCSGKKIHGNWIPISVSFRSALTNPIFPAHPSPRPAWAALGSCWRPGCCEGSGHVSVTAGAAQFLFFLFFWNSVLVLQKGLFGSIILGQTFLKLSRNTCEGFQSFRRSANWEEMKQKEKGSLRSFTCWEQLLRPSGRFWQGCVWIWQHRVLLALGSPPKMSCFREI